MSRRRWIVLALVLAISTGGFFVGRLLLRDPPLSAYELSAAEHLAGRWSAASRAALRADPKKGGISVADRLFAVCRDYASRVTVGKPLSDLNQKEVGESFGRRKEVEQECVDLSHDDGRPFVVSVNIEQTTKQALSGWWPFGLPESRSSKARITESYFAASPRWGIAGDPRSERAGVILAFHPPNTSPATKSFQQVIDAGGWWVVSEWLPKTGEHPSGRDDLGIKVEVHGTTGRLLEVRRDASDGRDDIVKGRVDRRFVYWYVTTGEGRLRFEVVASPTRFSRDQHLELIKDLVNVGKAS